MKFVELLNDKNVSGYALAKNTGIPYTTINDLINCKTVIQNVSLKYALLIADYLGVDVRELNNLSCYSPIKFRYFRNNTLMSLKNDGEINFAHNIFKSKEIDFYYKNNAKPYAFYLLALVDYLYKKNNLQINKKRYNQLRQEKLEKPFFVGSDMIVFNSIEEAEKQLNITVIPEFKKYNIIEDDIYNVA